MSGSGGDGVTFSYGDCERNGTIDKDIEEHHIYGEKIAEELLTKYNYPQDKIERVKQCVLNHRGSKDLPRNTIEEEIIADADVMAHFDSIPSLFSLAFKELNLDLHEGTEYVKKKLERDYNKLSNRTKNILEERYSNIINRISILPYNIIFNP